MDSAVLVKSIDVRWKSKQKRALMKIELTTDPSQAPLKAAQIEELER